MVNWTHSICASPRFQLGWNIIRPQFSIDFHFQPFHVFSLLRIPTFMALLCVSHFLAPSWDLYILRIRIWRIKFKFLSRPVCCVSLDGHCSSLSSSLLHYLFLFPKFCHLCRLGKFWMEPKQPKGWRSKLVFPLSSSGKGRRPSHKPHLCLDLFGFLIQDTLAIFVFRRQILTKRQFFLHIWL